MSERFRSMGCEVVVAGGDATLVRELFAADDARFTRFAADSELARVNRARGPVLVSDRFARAVRAALAAMQQTDGLVDPTLLDELEAAGYDRDFDALGAEADGAEPRGSDARGSAPRALPEPNRSRPDVRLVGRMLASDARLDLNGVVKSMAVDDSLVAGAADWVSAGGDVATTRPLEVALPGGGSVRLERGALATSGRSERRWTRNGQLRHHLIDPRTGQPADSPWEQVTACGATCLMADIAAKAAFLKGDEGPAWLDARGMPGRFLRPDGTIHLNETWRRSCT